MPSMNPQYLNLSIFLYETTNDAEAGERYGGSGFLLGVPSDAKTRGFHLFAVSNAHVVSNFPVVRLTKANGETDVVNCSKQWVPHKDGDDIAIAPLGPVSDADYDWVSLGGCVPKDQPAHHAVGVGDDCFMVGRYITYEGKQIEKPVVRFGNIAMLPELVYQDERFHDQLSYLADMRSLPGFSGSPVFWYLGDYGQRPAQSKRDDAPLEGGPTGTLLGTTHLLGIDWGHLPVPVDLLDEAGKRVVGKAQIRGPAWLRSSLPGN